MTLKDDCSELTCDEKSLRLHSVRQMQEYEPSVDVLINAHILNHIRPCLACLTLLLNCSHTHRVAKRQKWTLLEI